MNPEQLKAYKREKSRLFNANLRELRLKDKEKKQTADQQDNNNQPFKKVEPNKRLRPLNPDTRERNPATRQGNNQDDNQADELSLEDLMDIYETLDTKLDLLETKLETIIESKFETIIESKLDLLETKLETIIENKLYEPLDKLENNQPQPSIFFA